MKQIEIGFGIKICSFDNGNMFLENEDQDYVTLRCKL